MIGRLRNDAEDMTWVESVVDQAIRAALRAEGYTIRPGGTSDGYVATAPDGTETWLEFEVSERPIAEPAPGAAVQVDAEGCRRTGTVRFRGPGFFLVDWTYKDGSPGSTTVTATGGPPWRYVAPSPSTDGKAS